jgi:hypothetical protein
MLPILLALVAAQPATPSVIELPAPPPAKWVELKAAAVPYFLGSGDQKPLKWVAVDDGCSIDPRDGGKSAVFYAAARGTYRVVAVSADGEPVKVRITVGDPPPPPPGPAPNPNPTPPDPAPADPLVQRLLQVYKADGGTAETKAAARAKLADLYREAAKMATDGRFLTCGDLLDAVHDAAKSITADMLKGTREFVGQELLKVLPTNTDDPLLRIHRDATSALFAKLADGLDAAK